MIEIFLIYVCPMINEIVVSANGIIYFLFVWIKSIITSKVSLIV